MSLDVHLLRFKDVDTDLILKLWRYSEKPWVYDGAGQWKAMPPPDRGNFSSDQEWAEYRDLLRIKAKEMGLPEEAADQGRFGGEQISFPSKKHPEFPVGDWHSFSISRGIMERFTGHDMYFVFPDAKDVYGFFQPDWVTSKNRLADILKELQDLTQERKDDFHEFLVRLGIPENFVGRWKNVPQASGTDIFAGCLAQIEVMIETLDFVLNSGNPREFLLYWSA